MKKLFILIVTIIGISLSSMGQMAPTPEEDETEQGPSQSRQEWSKRTPEQRAQMQSQKMKEKLGLNDEQSKSVYDVVLSRAQKVDAIRIKTKADIMAVRLESDAKLKLILTPEQFTLMQKVKEQRGNRDSTQSGNNPNRKFKGGRGRGNR